MSDLTVFPFQPITMTRAQVAAVSYLARYTGRTHKLYAYQLRRWFTWCENNYLDPLPAGWSRPGRTPGPAACGPTPTPAPRCTPRNRP